MLASTSSRVSTAVVADTAASTHPHDARRATTGSHQTAAAPASAATTNAGTRPHSKAHLPTHGTASTAIGISRLSA